MASIIGEFQNCNNAFKLRNDIQFIVLIEWNKDPTNKKPVLQFEKVDLNRQKMTELQIPEYVDIVALSSRCKLKKL